MSASSHLIGIGGEEADAADELISALSSIAHSTPDPYFPPTEEPIADPEEDRLPPMFFKITKSVVETIAEEQKATRPKKPKHADQEIEDRAKKLGKELPKELQRNSNSVREYLLEDLAPKMLAVQMGTDQAKDTLRRTLGSEVVETPFLQLEQMARAASQLKMAQFVASHFKLPKKSAQELVDAIRPIQKHALVLPTSGPPDQEMTKKKRTATAPMMSRPRKPKDESKQ